MNDDPNGHQITPKALAGELVAELRLRANPENVAGMARFGISPVGTLGVTVVDVRALAGEAKRRLGRDKPALHELAANLWATGVHEARIMATVVEVPALVTREQAESWLLDVDSWDTCDQLCGNVLWKTAWAWDAPALWCARPETYVKRAGLVMAAQLGGKDKEAPDEKVVGVLGVVEPGCFDARNDVKKAASWALRGIGKRNARCNTAAIATAEHLLARVPERGGSDEERAARWVARDVLRELRSDAVRTRLGMG